MLNNGKQALANAARQADGNKGALGKGATVKKASTTDFPKECYDLIYKKAEYVLAQAYGTHLELMHPSALACLLARGAKS